MYNTSAAYKTEIAKRSINSSWKGRITLKDGTVLNFAKDSIDQNKSKLTRQYVYGETLEIGNAFSSELILGLRDTSSLVVSNHRYEFYEAVIELTFVLYGSSLSGGQEEVPCGIFTVDNAEFTYNTVKLTAYDNLNKAAKKNISAKLSNGDAYDGISALCTVAGLTLATTQQQIQAMPNGTTNWNLNSYKKGTAVKDIMEDILTCICANAVVNRAGEVVIKAYSSTPVKTVDDSQRYSSSYVDYLGRYTKLALENNNGDEEVYNATVQYGEGKLLTLSIGKNPLINSKTLANRSTIATNIINALAPILYAPLTISVPQDPSIDIGDALTGSHVVNESRTDTCTFINTKDEIQLFGQTKMTSAGGNYELANRKKATKVEKAVSDVEQQQVEIGENITIIQTQISELSGMINIGYILPISINANNIADGSSGDVLTFEFSTEEVTEGDIEYGEAVSFYSEMCFYIDTSATANTTYGDAILNVHYILDNDTVYSSAHAYGDGWKILTLNGFFANLDEGTHTFVVRFSMSGGAITTPA